MTSNRTFQVFLGLYISIFFILGLISEYVGRIFQASNNRPNYIVEEEID